MRPWSCLLCLCLAACGRIGIEERGVRDDAATADAPVDVAMIVDMPVDAPDDMAALACPTDMTRLSPTSNVCMDINSRGQAIWLDGKALCQGLGRRYCTDAEWFEGCTNAVGLVDIAGDGYEWVAEESAGVAQKRGAADCDDASAHVITDPYEVRCCGPMI